MNTIIDIKTMEKYSIFSKKGKKILKNYIKTYNNLGGSNITEEELKKLYKEGKSTAPPLQRMSSAIEIENIDAAKNECEKQYKKCMKKAKNIRSKYKSKKLFGNLSSYEKPRLQNPLPKKQLEATFRNP